MIAGEITSSIAYKSEKEGIAITKRIKAGVTVQIISINVPCVNDEEFKFWLCSKCHSVRPKIQETKIEITQIKNIKSWCKFIIPSIIGVAGSWKPNCQFSVESASIINDGKNNITKIEKSNLNMVFIFYYFVSQIKGISSKVWYAGGEVVTHSNVELPFTLFKLLNSQGEFTQGLLEVKDTNTI